MASVLSLPRQGICPLHCIPLPSCSGQFDDLQDVFRLLACVFFFPLYVLPNPFDDGDNVAKHKYGVRQMFGGRDQINLLYCYLPI